jgi:HSP20 family protein
MFKDKRSFFERITGSVPYEEEETVVVTETPEPKRESNWLRDEDAEPEGELTVDLYQTTSDVVIQTMVAGVKPEDLNISITREMVTIKGRRERPSDSPDAVYVHKELYWGAFSRTVMLPAEIDIEQSEAIERHGLLTLRLPKTDKDRTQKIKVKSI